MKFLILIPLVILASCGIKPSNEFTEEQVSNLTLACKASNGHIGRISRYEFLCYPNEKK